MWRGRPAPHAGSAAAAAARGGCLTFKLNGRRGFTLIECATVCAVVGVISALAVPSYRGHVLRAARSDAVDALTRLHVAQERHRGVHGSYASDFRQLPGAGPVSPQGSYTLQLAANGAGAYRASAQATGAQARDTACPALTLDVRDGFAQPGPNPQCWNR